MKITTLCYIEKDGCYLMMHRIKKKNDANHDKWIGVGGKFEEGELVWIPKAEVAQLPVWEGDRVFLRLLQTETPFFSLKLRYEGERLVETKLWGGESAYE